MEMAIEQYGIEGRHFMSDVLVLGSGFAGLWAALGAARRLDELGVTPGDVEITVISSRPYHDIRVRNYEADLTPCRIPLSTVLDPAGVAHVTAVVTAIDAASRTVTTSLGAYTYRRLVIALAARWSNPVCVSSDSTSTPTTAR